MNKNARQRRLFFKKLAFSAADLFHGLFAQDAVGSRETQMKSQIMGDLAPELLAMEAKRLGLDPDKDRDMVHQVILTAMGRPRKGNDTM